MPGIDFHRLRTEITMRQVLELLALEPTSPTRDQLPGACPVHGSTSRRSRSFSVNLTKGRYYCHKCHAHGNALELWAAVHKMTIYHSAIDVCRALGRDPPWIDRW